MASEEDFKKKQFNEQMMSGAVVTKQDIPSHIVAQANDYLRQIGENLAQVKGAEYLGSAAIHIYVAPTLKTMFFVPQSPLGKCPEVTASAAMGVLVGHLKQWYGRRGAKRRSGLIT